MNKYLRNQNPVKLDKAIIYCRVSSPKQVREGHGLDSQERRCREYASFRAYEVVDVFRDDMTGGEEKRPGMDSLIAFLRKHRTKEQHVVLIDDISRFARGMEAHVDLRKILREAGGKLESPTLEFNDDADSILVEHLLASVAQHQREKNAEQTFNRMRARMMNGYWVFQAPVGYRYERQGHHGKLLVPDQPVAGILKEALEGYAAGRFDSQAEIRQFLESQPLYPKNKQGKVVQQRVTDILDQPLYAGHITKADWKLKLIEGKHEPIVSLETWFKIQARRNGALKAPTRRDISADFPLRGFVLCADCGKPYTACWSHGMTKQYPYYLCDTKGCPSYRKSIKRTALEGAFEEIVQNLQPGEKLFALVRAMFTDAWKQRQAQASSLTDGLKRELTKLENQIDGFLNRIVDASSPSVITAYEKKIESLETQKLLIEDKLQNGSQPRYTFDELIELTCDFLASPWNLWRSGQLHLRRLVLKLAFAERMIYCRKNGYRTAKLSLPFKVLDQIQNHPEGMVRSRRLELPRVLPHSDLNAARLPIPPRPHIRLFPAPLSVEALHVAKGIWGRKRPFCINSQARDFSYAEML